MKIYDCKLNIDFGYITRKILNVFFYKFEKHKKIV